ncbi:hypothetical protein E6P09_02915 [Haloferax mediterranei ATCC 33500]|uniref:Uncharacterized protein n=2 Tax=Haloferax mediterranei (strain ATCC 33500 / DSM 1411 / JCM 8866 / NBRC 14739 / NCIMB 2177 / R-4) TaxID=523841 RepID=I3R8V0_HALMT|nr:hypothetical protein [Haloferax mediterranei]AFK20660.1 hypothetical protein HFX_2996 [Haloferax mediterranei ATCC 33500]MDX5987798.1 hypothetical protein [Haloferax mediterranei ATCC 33500]QCQ74276.1 hypothetical protein E6P09_02915 [Haloferax mediterranei ATCC 33500]
MTNRMEFRDGEIVFVEETFGGLDTAELIVGRDRLGEYELYLDIEGTVTLDEFVTAIGATELELDLSSFSTSTVEIRGANTGAEDDDVAELTRSLEETKRRGMPAIPDDTGLETPTDNTHYKRLVDNPDSQPAKYRRLIRNEGKIDRPKFDRWAHRQGYEPETGGSHNASLLMLERIGEIERRGRGDDQEIAWVGE